MNKKLKKYLDEGDKIEARIAELQEQLQSVRSAQEMEENNEIVKSIRMMKLNGRELFDLLCGLQDGTMKNSKEELAQKALSGREKPEQEQQGSASGQNSSENSQQKEREDMKHEENREEHH